MGIPDRFAEVTNGGKILNRRERRERRQRTQRLREAAEAYDVELEALITRTSGTLRATVFPAGIQHLTSPLPENDIRLTQPCATVDTLRGIATISSREVCHAQSVFFAASHHCHARVWLQFQKWHRGCHCSHHHTTVTQHYDRRGRCFHSDSVRGKLCQRGRRLLEWGDGDHDFCFVVKAYSRDSGC